MRIVTSARLRAVGILLLEVAALAALIAQRVGDDRALRVSVKSVVKKARAL
jgi:hypothetical protein